MPRKTFPVKLYQMLEHAAMDGQQHRSIVSWQSHGRCFRIHDKKRLEQELMPLFFKTRRYENFRKSLNNYGFKLIQGINNPDKGCYYHPKFIRTQHSLCSSIKLVIYSSAREEELRKRTTMYQNNSPRERLMPFQEPNFHFMNSTPAASTINTGRKDSDDKQTTPHARVNNDSDASLVSQHTSVSGVDIPNASKSRITTEILEIGKLACVEDGMKIDFDSYTFQLMKMLLPEDPRVLCNVFD